MKDLKTAFREIFFSYGAALLESEQLVNYLSDWQIGIDKPTKNVVRAIVNQGYGKKIFEKAKKDELKCEESEFLTNEISQETGFMPELVKNVVGAIFYGLRVESKTDCIVHSTANVLTNASVQTNSLEKDNIETRYGNKSQLSLDDFFPVEGIVIGKTTWEAAKKYGFKVERPRGANNGRAKVARLNWGLTVWDFEGVGIFYDFYFSKKNRMPLIWTMLGMDKSMSYQSWIKWLHNKGFKVVIVENPTVKILADRNVFSSLIKATDFLNTIEIQLKFDYGNENGEGSESDSLNSLYSISMKAI